MTRLDVERALFPVLMCSAGGLGDTTALTGLLVGGADADAADYDGRTALHLAASEGQVEATPPRGRGGRRQPPRYLGPFAPHARRRGARRSDTSQGARGDTSRSQAGKTRASTAIRRASTSVHGAERSTVATRIVWPWTRIASSTSRSVVG